jgi:hypothetical protein
VRTSTLNIITKKKGNWNMKTITIAFDVDGTLITNVAADIYQQKRPPIGQPYDYDTPNRDIVELLVILSRFKNVKIVVWSGGGKQYAQMWVDRLKLNKWVWKVTGKLDGEIKPDIAIDDIHSCELGLVNLIVRQK